MHITWKSFWISRMKKSSFQCQWLVILCLNLENRETVKSLYNIISVLTWVCWYKNISMQSWYILNITISFFLFSWLVFKDQASDKRHPPAEQSSTSGWRANHIGPNTGGWDCWPGGGAHPTASPNRPQTPSAESLLWCPALVRP